MNEYNPVDVCHYCNDRMYEYLKKQIQEKIESLQNDINEHPNHGPKYLPVLIIQELKSLLNGDVEQ